MNTIQQYEKYKDSGIAWIGEIPEHWERTKIKNILSIPICDGPHETPQLLDDGIPFLSAEAIKNNQLNFNLKRGYISSEDHTRFCKKTKPKINDILIVKSGATTGNVALVKTTQEFSIWSPLALLRANLKVISYKYFFLYVQSFIFKQQIEQFWNYGTQQNIGMEKISNLFIAFPPLSEQEQIADYLDKKCALIDESIEKSKTSIEKLKEYKQAIITEAVTKGLNKSAPLKNSNIEWIGQIPEHWEVKKLKFVTLCNQKTLSEDTNPEQEINYIEIGSVTNENGIETFETMSFENAPSRARRIVSFGDTILSTVRTYLKAIAYINNNYDKFICSTGFAVFTPKNEILNKFLFYCLHSEWFISLVEASSVGISYPAINTTNLINFKILLPSLSEQEEIAAYLDKKCAEIDTAIQGKETLIEKLTEYKKSLIFECVTGKRKVAVC